MCNMHGSFSLSTSAMLLTEWVSMCSHSELYLCDLGKIVELNVGDRDKCTYEEQYPGVSQQNIPNYFSHLQVYPSIS